MLEVIVARLEGFLWQPPGRFANGIGRFILPVLRMVYCLARDIAAGQLTLRAMSLVYTTLLSVVPLIAFSFSVLKGFGFHHKVVPMLYSVLEPLGEKGVALTDRLIGFVDNVSGRVLGGVGLLMLVFTVLSMIQKVETSFNYIWNIEHTRSLLRRFSDYLSVLLIGPVVMAGAMGMIGTVSSNAIVQRLSAMEPFGTALVVAGRLAPVVLLTLLFTFLYMFIVNTRVRGVAALVGGASAGLMWVIASALFTAFVVGSTKYAAIYSSFAIVIIALIWLYLAWLILLIGSQIAFYVQHPECMRTGKRLVTAVGRQRDAMALEIMRRVGHSFLSASPGDDLVGISAAMGVPVEALGPVADSLERAGVLTRTAQGALIPGRDLAAIRLYDILDAAGHSPGDTAMTSGWTQHDVDAVLDELKSAVRAGLRDRTLRDLLEKEQRGG